MPRIKWAVFVIPLEPIAICGHIIWHSVWHWFSRLCNNSFADVSFRWNGLICYDNVTFLQFIKPVEEPINEYYISRSYCRTHWRSFTVTNWEQVLINTVEGSNCGYDTQSCPKLFTHLLDIINKLRSFYINRITQVLSLFKGFVLYDFLFLGLVTFICSGFHLKAPSARNIFLNFCSSDRYW